MGEKKQSRILFALLLLLVFFLLLVAFFLIRILMGMTVVDPGAPGAHPRPGRADTGPAIGETVIDAGGTARRPAVPGGEGARRPRTGAEAAAEETTGGTNRTHGAGADGTGIAGEEPTVCQTYGHQVTSRERYPHPIRYEAEFRPDGVVFHLYPEDRPAAAPADAAGDKQP